ncbi:hypothetical protein ACWDZ8_05435, partial [Streptomyces sp. NPDC003233]
RVHPCRHGVALQSRDRLQVLAGPSRYSRGTAGAASAVRRLRAELRRIDRRDFFPPLERDRVHAAVRALADEPGSKAGTASKAASHPEKNA